MGIGNLRHPSDLPFASKLVTPHVSVHQSEGVTSHDLPFLAVDRIATARENCGFIDQKAFETAGNHGFDSLILTDIKHASAQWLHLVHVR